MYNLQIVEKSCFGQPSMCLSVGLSCCRFSRELSRAYGLPDQVETLGARSLM